jgi:hypothetical protein
MQANALTDTWRAVTAAARAGIRLLLLPQHQDELV